MPLSLMFVGVVVGEVVTSFGVDPDCVAVTVIPLVLPVTDTPVVACNKNKIIALLFLPKNINILNNNLLLPRQFHKCFLETNAEEITSETSHYTR